jgi:hypothetical protein
VPSTAVEEEGTSRVPAVPRTFRISRAGLAGIEKAKSSSGDRTTTHAGGSGIPDTRPGSGAAAPGASSPLTITLHHIKITASRHATVATGLPKPCRHL